MGKGSQHAKTRLCGLAYLTLVTVDVIVFVHSNHSKTSLLTL